MNEEILENLNKRLDEALERGRKIVEDEELAQKVDDLRIRAGHLIREHPVKSVALGLAAGFILGRLLTDDR